MRWPSSGSLQTAPTWLGGGAGPPTASAPSATYMCRLTMIAAPMQEAQNKQRREAAERVRAQREVA
eukprot:13671034-Alexandrium_andersonii.AAC.1